MTREIQIVIAGAGIGGLSLAGFLRRAGLEPVVVERAESIDKPDGPLELFPQAMALLARLGVADEVRAAGTTVTQWLRRRPDGTIAARLDADDPGGFVAIPYGCLRERLLAELPSESVRTGTALQSVETSGGAVVVTFGNGVREQFDLAVGADGARSRIRDLLGVGPPVHCGTRSVAFPLPRDADPPAASEVWTGEGVVFRALPAGDRPTGWLTVPRELGGNLADALERAGTDWGAVACLEGHGNETLPDLLRSIDPAAVWRAEDVRASTDVWAEGRVALVGDAAHARHRLAGVGPTLALEDAAALAADLIGQDGAPSTRLSAYADRRQARMRRLPERSGGDSCNPLRTVDVPFADEESRILAVRGSQLAAAFGPDSPQPAITLPPSQV